jgi:hypothetical protein
MSMVGISYSNHNNGHTRFCESHTSVGRHCSCFSLWAIVNSAPVMALVIKGSRAQHSPSSFSCFNLLMPKGPGCSAFLLLACCPGSSRLVPVANDVFAVLQFLMSTGDSRFSGNGVSSSFFYKFSFQCVLVTLGHQLISGV